MGGYKRNPIKHIKIEMQDGRIFELPGADVDGASMETDQDGTTTCYLSFLAPNIWQTYYIPDELGAGSMVLIALPDSEKE